MPFLAIINTQVNSKYIFFLKKSQQNMYSESARLGFVAILEICLQIKLSIQQNWKGDV